MNILLISPLRNYPMKNEMYPSGALLLLGTMLKKAGHQVKIVHEVIDGEEIALMSLYKVDIVGISLSTFQTKRTKLLTEVIKKTYPNVTIVAGGPHPSALRQKLLVDFPNIDIGVVGEGEKPMLEIAGGKPLKSINGITYHNGMGINMNVRNSLIKDLDNLPIPDLSMVDIRKYTGAYPLGKLPSMFIMASRGCPFHCTFCSKSIYGNTVRYHSVEYVLEQLDYYKSLGIREVFFQDDTFNYDRAWLEKLLKAIIEKGLNKSMRFRAPFRVNKKLVDADLLKLMKQAGFWLIFYGVESGNQAMLNRMKKGITLEEVKRAFKLTHEAGIKTEASFIIGLPGETEATIKDSIKLYQEIRPYWAGFSKAIPFPGTVLYDQVKSTIPYDRYMPGKTMFVDGFLTAQQLDYWANVCDKLLLRDKVLKMLPHPLQMLRYARGR